MRYSRKGAFVGGSGGGGAYRLTPSEIERLRNDARARLDEARRDGEINTYLQGQLVEINDRDVETLNERLQDIGDAMAEADLEVDRLLFGGSVAKHTYVDGLSDVDALVVMSVGDGTSPDDLRAELRSALEKYLDLGAVVAIREGDLAVTVTYRDGPEVQLLPAAERADGSMAIASVDGRRWLDINPKEFAARLSALNQRQAGAVVPAVKLAKAVIDNQFGADRAVSGYHLEALALSAFDRYEGIRTPKAMLTHFFEKASADVLHPISDITGQSRYVDEYLGGSESEARKVVSRRFQQLARAMHRSESADDWRALMEG